MKEWIQMLADLQVQAHLGNPLSELFVTPVPHERNEQELSEWLRQVCAQEEEVRTNVRRVGTDFDREWLDVYFPMYRHSCFQYQRTCEYAPLCHDRLAPDCGLYQIRKDHHEIIQQDS